MSRPNSKFFVLECVVAAAYVWYCFSMVQSVGDTDYSGAMFYNGVSRFCYAVAHWFGSVGLNAELKAHAIIEDGRMI